MRAIFWVSMISAAALVGCGTTGVVPIGNGIYMSSKMGGMTDWNGGVVKAELFKEAAAYCAKLGKQPIPVSSTSQDAGMATYASAEVQFRCE